jgi:Ribbon-helix-helix protein, copG family
MMPHVRTTVTLDEDVAAKLKQAARERGVSFKVALNDAVRDGLRGGTKPARRFLVQARPMGVRPGVNLDKALRLAGELEDEEILRKMALRK